MRFLARMRLGPENGVRLLFRVARRPLVALPAPPIQDSPLGQNTRGNLDRATTRVDRVGVTKSNSSKALDLVNPNCSHSLEVVVLHCEARNR